MSTKLVSFALDETAEGDIILRGVIDPESFDTLLVDSYQREVLPISSITKLVRAFETGKIPDIELGMRGHKVVERGDAIYLQDPVYIIDGLQRVSAARLKIERAEGRTPRLGAVVHFGTTEKWERDRFQILNQDRTKLSPNVLLRNMSHDYTSIASLYALSQDKSFVMEGRICWQQRMLRKELITATTFAKTVGRLHAHLGPGRSVRIDQLANGLEKIQGRVGRRTMVDNTRTFFDILDNAYGVRRVAFKQGATYMRGGFLLSLARVFSQHLDFWEDSRLVVERSLQRKISLFPYSDPQVVQLASGAGKSGDLLYLLMVDHINSGKRSRRLRPRNVDYPDFELEDDSESELAA